VAEARLIAAAGSWEPGSAITTTARDFVAFIHDATVVSVMSNAEDDTAYSSVFGAFPYAFRTAESRLFRSYAVVGTLVAIVAALAFVVSLMITLSDTLAGSVGTFSFSRAFIIVVGLMVVGPLIAPILSVAYRRRTGGGDAQYEARIGALGYLYIFTLILFLLITAPPEYRDPPSGVFAPLIEALYGLDPAFGFLPPTLVAIAMYLAHRRW